MEDKDWKEICQRKNLEIIALKEENAILSAKIEKLEKKTKKWDELAEKIGECYNETDDFQLLNIGEIAASACGYL